MRLRIIATGMALAVAALAGAQDSMKPVMVLTYHVVAGRVDATALAALIKDGHGKARLKTVQGGELWASMKGSKVIITDEKGGWAAVTIPDVHQSNGVIHVVDTVLMPR